jgi:hypothetical protein
MFQAQTVIFASVKLKKKKLYTISQKIILRHFYTIHLKQISKFNIIYFTINMTQ